MGSWLALRLKRNGPSSTRQAPGTELYTLDLKKGEGRTAEQGDILTVDYTVWLHDSRATDAKGQYIDSSLENGSPFSFRLGAGHAIRGWDQGLAGMAVGGKRMLIVPPQLAYGRQGAGGLIPPDATLVFDVDLCTLQKGDGD